MVRHRRSNSVVPRTAYGNADPDHLVPTWVPSPARCRVMRGARSPGPVACSGIVGPERCCHRTSSPHFLSLAPELRWRAPAECPPAHRVQARIDTYAGTGTASAAAEVQVDAVVPCVNERWYLALAIKRGADREVRELDDIECEGLAESAAVLVAIAIAQERAAVPEPPAPEPPAPEPPAAAVRRPEHSPAREATRSPSPGVAVVRRRGDDATASSTARPARPPTHASARVAGGTSLGWLPLGGDVGVALALWWHRLRVELEGTSRICRRRVSTRRAGPSRRTPPTSSRARR